tara:strand:- start:85 stop:675 length:591 start_codon:yes stop_codon:yes gene_type:complete
MYIIADVPKEILSKLEICIQEKGLDKYNKELAGNIKREYGIPKGKSIISPFLMQMILAYNEKYPNFWKVKHSMMKYKPVDVELQSLWVNFQKKHEFNPMHTHDGIYSFVIWHKVPYSIDDEKAQFHETNKDDIRAGMFSFFMLDPSGRIYQQPIPVDKTWEGKIALFPADLNHMVYPFYTSDDYRVSISGNLGFRI